MNAENHHINSIINKALELGFICQRTEMNKWAIYLPNDYILSQTETQWRLSIEGNLEIALENPRVLEFLKDFQ